MTVKKPKIITESQGDVYMKQPEFPSSQTFKICNQSGENLRGCYYTDSKRNYVFLETHECIDDIYATSEHESLHSAIDICRTWEFEDVQDGKLREKHCMRMDDHEEHNIIRIILLADEYL